MNIAQGMQKCFSGGSEVKVSACNMGDLGSIPGSGRSPAEGNGNPLQYSCLKNPVDGGAWWATVHRVAKSWIRLSDFTFTLDKSRIISPSHSPQLNHIFKVSFAMQSNIFAFLRIRVWTSGGGGVLTLPTTISKCWADWQGQ